jgi:5-methylcytosine-specific restriction protein A
MPSKPASGCHISNCPDLSVEQSGFCEEHLKERNRQQDKNRGTSTERGYGYGWRKLREWYLTEHPLCVECERAGVVSAATLIHHIDRDTSNNQESNLKALCADCHQQQHQNDIFKKKTDKG